MASGAQQMAEHHLPLGDEPTLATDQVAFLDVAEGGDPRIGRVIDCDDPVQNLRAYLRTQAPEAFL